MKSTAAAGFEAQAAASEVMPPATSTLPDGSMAYPGQLARHVHRYGLAEPRCSRVEEERLLRRLAQEHYVVAARDQHLAVIEQLRR